MYLKSREVFRESFSWKRGSRSSNSAKVLARNGYFGLRPGLSPWKGRLSVFACLIDVNRMAKTNASIPEPATHLPPSYSGGAARIGREGVRLRCTAHP